MSFLRKYQLASEDGGMAWDKTYSLVFTHNAEMRVLVVKQFEQPFKTPDVDEVEPKDFSRYAVGGRSLKDLVLQKLHELLPKTPAKSPTDAP
jgi:hypothetical protein